jgi:hypothetical protein
MGYLTVLFHMHILYGITCLDVGVNEKDEGRGGLF